ncbi:MAG: hypothetical protein PHO83_15525 [Geobacteraceae bacterium]|nr:hypothetical protein [Geobacteraceae bacterium]
MSNATTTATISGTSNRAQTGFEVDRTLTGTFQVKLWGRFHPGWLGALSSGLSRHRISIISGSAKKTGTSWDASFEVTSTRFASDPLKLDFLALAREDNDAVAESVFSLSQFTLEPPAKHHGALYLEVKAADQLGFLGQLLNRLAFLLLFPEEISIDTVQGRIFDKFWIRGLGGTTPSETAQAALEKKLAECRHA